MTNHRISSNSMVYSRNQITQELVSENKKKIIKSNLFILKKPYGMFPIQKY
jgi:hypothetical protein